MLKESLYSYYKKEQDSRNYLGASLIGHECERFIWNKWNKIAEDPITGRIGRLFERGNREEKWILDDLIALGWNITGIQQKVNLSVKNMGGSCDAILNDNTILEIKTANKASFSKLKSEGVRLNKPQHFYQMQLYMHGLSLKKAIYLCVCKDNDEMYEEEIEYIESAALMMLEKGKYIMNVKIPPNILPVGERWKCRYCTFKEICYGSV